MTIHQPNSEIYALFDNLILMVEGRFIYQGAADDAPAYFANNFGLSFPVYMNPADYFMSIMHHEKKENLERYPRYFEVYDAQLAPRVNKEIANENIDPI